MFQMLSFLVETCTTGKDHQSTENEPPVAVFVLTTEGKAGKWKE